MKKSIKRIVAMTCALVLGASTLVYANAPETREITFGVNITVDGQAVTFPADSRPFIMDGRTFLPKAALAELLGFTVSWDAATNTVIVMSPGYVPAPAVPAPAPEPVYVPAPVEEVVEEIEEEAEELVEEVEEEVEEVVEEAAEAGIFTPGTVETSAEGYGGLIHVAVTFSATEIVSIEITDHSETPAFFGFVEPALTTLIVAQQSTGGIDVTTMATYTHNAIIAAVEAAIEQARI